MQADINRLKDAIKQHGRASHEDSKALHIITLKIRAQCQLKCGLCKKYVIPDLESSYYTMSRR